MAPDVDLVAFVTRSENRVATLRAMTSGPRTRPELQEETGIPRATLSRTLADFWRLDLATRNGHAYRATPLGEYVATQLGTMAEAIGTIRELQAIEQWLPLEAFGFDLADLADAEVIRQTPADPHAPVKKVVPVLEAADHVQALCNNAVHEPIIAEWHAVTQGRQRLEAVFTADVVDVIASDPRMARLFRDMVTAVDADAYVHEGDIPCLILIADETVLLEAADDEGAIKAFVVTDDESICSWAEATFEAHRREAESVDGGVLTP